MKQTTLCYILRSDGAILLMHRTKKRDDPNAGKWIGIGGKIEPGETVQECLCREVLEETGLVLQRYQYRGIVTFVSDCYETERMHLFTADRYDGRLCDFCTEGELRFVYPTQMCQLPMWQGDMVFLKLLQQKAPFFSLELIYRGEMLDRAILNGEEYIWKSC